MKFLIRADASNEIGTGHVMRCIALGQMLFDEGHEISFLTQTDNENINNRIFNEGFVFNYFKEDDLISDSNYTTIFGQRIKADWIVTDGYKFTTEYQQIIKNKGFKLLCIDDIAKCHYVSDIVLNQNMNAEKIYKYSSEKYTKLLLGTDYILLRREFRENEKWVRVVREECENILITMGGSDPENKTHIVLDSIINSTIKKINVKIIVGPNYIFEDRLNILSRNSKVNVILLKKVENMCEEIKWCDIAITAGGSSIWEFAFLQTPVLAGYIAKNQENIVKQLLSSDSIISANNFNDVLKITESFEKLVSSHLLRKELSLNIKGVLKNNNKWYAKEFS